MCFPRSMYVDSVSGPLTLVGLMDPMEFKRDVWLLKRREQVAGASSSVAPLAASMVRGGRAGDNSSGVNNMILAQKMDEQSATTDEQTAKMHF